MEHIILWISKLPVSVQVTIALVLTVATVYCAIVIVRKGFKFSKEGFEFPWKKGKKESSPHKKCVHSKDVMRVLIALPQLTVEKVMLTHFEGARQVMNYAKQQSDIAIAIMQKNYISALDSKGIDNMVASVSYMVYRLLLRDMKRNILDEIRSIIEEKNYIGLGDTEFDRWVNLKINYLISHATDYLNEEYFYRVDLTREEVYDANKKIVPNLEAIFREFFYMARKIAEDHSRAVANIDVQIAKLQEDFN